MTTTRPLITDRQNLKKTHHPLLLLNFLKTFKTYSLPTKLIFVPSKKLSEHAASKWEVENKYLSSGFAKLLNPIHHRALSFPLILLLLLLLYNNNKLPLILLILPHYINPL